MSDYQLKLPGMPDIPEPEPRVRLHHSQPLGNPTWCTGTQYKVKETDAWVKTAMAGHAVFEQWMVAGRTHCTGCNAAYYANHNRKPNDAPISFTGPDALALMMSTTKCAICGGDGSDADSRGHRLAIDHNHTTGNLRGMVCHLHNRAIGQLEEYWDVATAYLKETPT